MMTSVSICGAETEHLAVRPPSVEAEAITRLRLATAIGILAEVILPVIEAICLARPDWLAIKIQGTWFVFTVMLLVATWHPQFGRIWKPAVLLFATATIVSAGILSINGVTLAPFMFLLVLLPIGGTILPWGPGWQAGLCLICVLFGFLFSSQFDWQNHLVIPGLSAMVLSILGSYFVSAALHRQRINLNRQRINLNFHLQALTQSEAKFRTIFEMSPSLIAIHSIPDGCLVDVNPAWERTFGYSRTEVLGQLRPDLASTRARDGFVQWVSSLRTGDAGIGEGPEVFHSRDGSPVRCLYSWSALELNGRACVLVIGQDITARVQAEEELNRNREVLINQERLKAVGELASGIAHDLNNSLNVLSLRLELLYRDQRLLQDHSESLQLISRVVHDAASTIGRLQDFARRRHDRPVESVDLNATIKESVEIAKSTLEERNSLLGRSILVEVELPRLPLIVGEPSELRQIFLNLLLNAQDAMPAGGTIRIAGRADDKSIIVRVEDQGQGIPQEHLQRIFDPFFSTKGERGTGLGLSIAYSAMERMGGTITAANRLEGGAVFTLRFQAAYAKKPVGNAEKHLASTEQCRVMVTDDDQNNLRALTALLESKGHIVVTANSGAEALEKLLGGSCPVDLLLCDLGMPLINGWEVARRVKSLESAPPVYLVTGWAQEIPAEDPRRAFVDGMIAKPVDPKLLDQLLVKHKRGRESQMRPAAHDRCERAAALGGR